MMKKFCFVNKGKKGFVAAFVIIAIAAVLSVLLTSCGEETESEGSSKKEVRVYCFGDYIDPELIDDFEKDTGIRVIMDNFDTNEEMFPIIEKGAVKYDVVCASDYMIEKMGKRNFLRELPKEAIPNRKNVPDKFMEIAADFDKGNKYSLPHTYGTMGILYNSKKIKPGEITSWNDLWKKKYGGWVVMPDSMRDTFGIALKAEGKSINDFSKGSLDSAAEYLIQQKPLVYKYANDSARDMMIGEYTDIAIVWNGEVLYSKEENPDLEFVIPKEGTEEFLDLWAIPVTSQNPENGAKWINYMLSKKAALKNFEYLTYSIPNKYVIDQVSDNPEEMKVLFPSDELLKKCELLKPMPPKYEEYYSLCWKRFKTA